MRTYRGHNYVSYNMVQGSSREVVLDTLLEKHTGLVVPEAAASTLAAIRLLALAVGTPAMQRQIPCKIRIILLRSKIAQNRNNRARHFLGY